MSDPYMILQESEEKTTAVKTAPPSDLPDDPYKEPDKEKKPRKTRREDPSESPENNGGKDGKTPRAVVGKAGKKATRRRIAGRIGVCVGGLLVFVIAAVLITCVVLLKGPSESMRNALVLSAKQASATKWIPGLFLDHALVEQIEKDSKTVTHDVMSMDDVKPAAQEDEQKDEWADAIDGIRFDVIIKPNFKAYMLIIKDPTRVSVGWGSDYAAGKSGGMKIFGIAEKYGAVAAMNGGEFSDVGGMGAGDLPMGLTYSHGVRFSGNTGKTFMGFDKDNRLIVSEGMTVQRATELGIRDGVSFQTGNALITNDGANVSYHYAPGNTGVAQRSCIAQRADGAVLMLVTDGRTAQSLGATYDECINILVEYGAVAAGMLDGGSSAMLYYRDYYNLYNYDLSELDEYQQQGLVNKYKAFTRPRTIPTYFIVGEAQNNG